MTVLHLLNILLKQWNFNKCIRWVIPRGPMVPGGPLGPVRPGSHSLLI